jgi:hypothetical protein
VTALKTHDARMNLVYLLTQSTKTSTSADIKSDNGIASSRNIKPIESGNLSASQGLEDVVDMEVQAHLFPLHYTTFESLSKVHNHLFFPETRTVYTLY